MHGIALDIGDFAAGYPNGQLSIPCASSLAVCGDKFRLHAIKKFAIVAFV
jgi:hypothetical protein